MFPGILCLSKQPEIRNIKAKYQKILEKWVFFLIYRKLFCLKMIIYIPGVLHNCLQSPVAHNIANVKQFFSG